MKTGQQKRLEREKGPHRQGWMTSTEFAAYLGVDARTFRRWQASEYVMAPAEHTSCGWALWSPQQQTEMMNKRARVR